MLERLCSWHKNPINTVLHIIAFIVWSYAAWINSWKWMLGAVVIALIGHIIQMSMEKPARAPVAPVKAKRRRR